MASLVHIKGLEEIVRTLERLPPEVVGAKGGPVRVALRKAAVVIQKEAQANIDRLVQEGETAETSGTLKKALIVSRKKPAGFKGERFWVRLKRGAKNPSGVSVNTYGAALEFGDERMPAKAWMRRAWEAKKQEVLDTFVREMPKAIDAAIKKAKRKR